MRARRTGAWEGRVEPAADASARADAGRRAVLLALAGGAIAMGCGAAPRAPRAAERSPSPPARGPERERHLPLPPRPSDAPAGRRFLDRCAGWTQPERETAVMRQILGGNVPDFERRLVRVPLAAAGRIQARGAVWVLPDYLAIGSDDDFVRMPMAARTAQRIARALGCSLPTPHLVDAVYEAAPGKLTSPSLPAGGGMTHVGYFEAHEKAVEERRHAAGLAVGVLTAGHKKDIVITKRLRVAPGRLAIYGWFREDGTPIQPVSTIHDDDYVDYTNGVRLVLGTMEVDGVERSLGSVMADETLWPLVSDEGPSTFTEYPYSR